MTFTTALPDAQQLLALEEQDVGFSPLGEMVGNAATNNSAADYDHLGVTWQI